MFKHWKEAEKRAAELKEAIDKIASEMSTEESEARSEETSVEKREELIRALKDKVTERDKLQTEYNDVISQRDNLKAAEEKQFGLLANLTTSRIAERKKRTEDKDVCETRSYELAWAEYIRTGNDATVRSLVSTQNNEGADIMIPTTLANKIEDTMRTGGRIINLCDTVFIKGITEYPVVIDRTDPELHNEIGGIKKKEKEIKLTSVTMDAQFIAEILRTTRKFEADSISAFWDWLMAELPDALRRVIDRKILTGGQDRNEGIHGILTNTNALFVATLADHELYFNTANCAVSHLDDGIEDNVTLVMNRKTFFNNVMGLRGADGHPIWQQVMTSNLNRPEFSMGGYPVVFSNEIPAYDEAGDGDTYMIAGNFKAMKLNFPEGMNVQLTRDAITEMDNNYVRYRSEIYVAGNITRPSSFVKVTK